MEVTIKMNGQALSVEVSVEVYECLDRADHKEENLAHEKRRHWDIREFDEYIVATEGRGYQETPEEYVCRKETRNELLSILESCTEAQRRRQRPRRRTTPTRQPACYFAASATRPNNAA